jgi:hypothetical protein
MEVKEGLFVWYGNRILYMFFAKSIYVLGESD